MVRILTLRVALVTSFAFFIISWSSLAVVLMRSPEPLSKILFSALSSTPTKPPPLARPPPRPWNPWRSDRAALVYMYEDRGPKPPKGAKTPSVPLDEDVTFDAPLHSRPPPLPPPRHVAACSPAPPAFSNPKPCCKPAISWLESSLILTQAQELAKLFAPLPSLARISLSAFLQPLIAASLCDDDTAYVITGDIRPMWIRDSVGQVQPYLYSLYRGDSLAATIFRGIIRRQAIYMLHDVYGNAFRLRPKLLQEGIDSLGRSPLVGTRNFETDSFGYFMVISGQYWNATKDKTLFAEDPLWLDAIEHVVKIIRLEQRHEKSNYTYPELVNNGRGPNCTYTGMTWTGFRPSDEPCTYPYLLPSNMLVVLGLRDVATILKEADIPVPELYASVRALVNEIDAGIHHYGVFRNKSLGPIYSFETDGFGNHLLIDDANVPSLLSLPYLRYRSPRDPSGEIQRNTRAFVLSAANQFYFKGKAAEGIGSSHTPGRLWPMSIVARALGSESHAEIIDCVRQLLATTAHTSAIHESFLPDSPEHYTRPWFSWAASLFAELVWRKRTFLSRNLELLRTDVVLSPPS